MMYCQTKPFKLPFYLQEIDLTYQTMTGELLIPSSTSHSGVFSFRAQYE